MDIPGQTILILGLAREGQSLARYFQRQGAHVVVTDSAPPDRLRDRTEQLDPAIELFLGRDFPELVDRAQRFFVSPGVPPTNSVYSAAVKAGLTIESMTTLFFELCPAGIVGITGSSGKTTTTGLIGQILREAGRDVLVAGNIGDPMLELLPQITADSIVVLELSSFQLEVLRRSPHIAVVTNISPNHLDRHGDMDTYIAAKTNIVAHQTPADYVVLNAGDPESVTFQNASPAMTRWFGEISTADSGATVRAGAVGCVADGEFHPVMPVDEIPLIGRHNVENVLAALAVTAILQVEPASQAAGISAFRPPAHRLQIVGERHGVRYIDDSIATSPARASVALRAIDTPVILIAGGRDKKLPWDEFAGLTARKARALLLIGEAAPIIDSAVRPHLSTESAVLQADAIHYCDSLPEAVSAASRLAARGDAVLLSPGCTSYDMFTDFEERGAIFARAVEGLDAA